MHVKLLLMVNPSQKVHVMQVNCLVMTVNK